MVIKLQKYFSFATQINQCIWYKYSAKLLKMLEWVKN